MFLCLWKFHDSLPRFLDQEDGPERHEPHLRDHGDSGIILTSILSRYANIKSQMAPQMRSIWIGQDAVPNDVLNDVYIV